MPDPPFEPTLSIGPKMLSPEAQHILDQFLEALEDSEALEGCQSKTSVRGLARRTQLHPSTVHHHLKSIQHLRLIRLVHLEGNRPHWEPVWDELRRLGYAD